MRKLEKPTDDNEKQVDFLREEDYDNWKDYGNDINLVKLENVFENIGKIKWKYMKC